MFNLLEKVMNKNNNISFTYMNDNKNELINLLDPNFYTIIDIHENIFNLLYYDERLYSIYLTDYSLTNNKINKNKEILLHIVFNELTNKFFIWFKKYQLQNTTLKLKLSKQNIFYYNIYDINLCINKFKNIFYHYTGYSWDTYNCTLDYKQLPKKYKIIKIDKNIDKKFNFIKQIIKYMKNDNIFDIKLQNITKENLQKGLKLLYDIKNLYTLEINKEIIKLIKKFTSYIHIIAIKNTDIKFIKKEDMNIFIKKIISVYPNDINEIITDNTVKQLKNLLTILIKTDIVYKEISKYVLYNKGNHNYEIQILDIFKYNNTK